MKPPLLCMHVDNWSEPEQLLHCILEWSKPHVIANMAGNQVSIRYVTANCTQTDEFQDELVMVL